MTGVEKGRRGWGGATGEGAVEVVRDLVAALGEIPAASAGMTEAIRAGMTEVREDGNDGRCQTARR